MARKKKAELAAGPDLPADYADFLEALKNRVRQAQTKAMLAVNRELIKLYWDLGRRIVERQETAGWGRAVVERLADDIQKAFPGVGGFSRTNVFRMRAFYLAYQGLAESVPQAVGQSPEQSPPEAMANLPWGHNVLLVERIKDDSQRL
jgi:hypothetical protein